MIVLMENIRCAEPGKLPTKELAKLKKPNNNKKISLYISGQPPVLVQQQPLILLYAFVFKRHVRPLLEATNYCS